MFYYKWSNFVPWWLMIHLVFCPVLVSCLKFATVPASWFAHKICNALNEERADTTILLYNSQTYKLFVLSFFFLVRNSFVVLLRLGYCFCLFVFYLVFFRTVYCHKRLIIKKKWLKKIDGRQKQEWKCLSTWIIVYVIHI